MRHSFMVSGKPSLVTATVGGAVGALLFSAVLFVAPAAGAGLVDLPRLVGGIFTGSDSAALWLGFWLLFAVGWLLLPALLIGLWSPLPGGPLTVPGAVVRGSLLGVALWAVLGLVLPLLGLLTRVEAAAGTGLFALSLGWGAAVALLVASLGYGVVVACIAILSQGLAPLDAVGWENHGSGRAA